MSRPKSAPRPQRHKKPDAESRLSTRSANVRITKPLDAKFEQQITGLVKQFMTRSLLLSAAILVVCEILISRAHIPAKSLPPYMALVTFAIVFPFVRGAARVFAQIKQAGRQRCEQRRFADAQFALEYFHRFGQMSFDPDGEAHYFLTRAYLGLGEFQQAGQMARWMQRHRRKSEWTRKAQDAVQTSEKNQLQES